MVVRTRSALRTEETERALEQGERSMESPSGDREEVAGRGVGSSQLKLDPPV